MKNIKDFSTVLVLVLVFAALALGFAPGTSDALHNARAAASAPMTTTMDWQTLIPAAGLDDVDANPVSNFGTAPTFTSGLYTAGTGLSGGDLATTATAGTRNIVLLKGMGGTTLVFRVRYPTAVGAGTSVTFCVGGIGQGSSDYWQRLLQTGTAARSITITTKSTDMTDGTWKYTDVDILTHSMDNVGSWGIVAGVEVTTFGSTAVLQVKGI